MTDQAITQGVHHIGFTVPDIQQTRTFFVETLGFKQVGEKPNYPAVFVSDGQIMLTLWQASQPKTATPFDRKNNIGLHHIALKLPNADALLKLHHTLTQHPNVQIEFAPEDLGTPGGPQHMMCTIPGGLRVEFIALPPT